MIFKTVAYLSALVILDGLRGRKADNPKVPMPTECSRCGNELDYEEIEISLYDDENDVICNKCYHDQYEFTCCVCEDYGHVDDQHNMLVVFDPGVIDWHFDMQPGIYRITGTPYYGVPMIGKSYIFRRHIEWIAPLPVPSNHLGFPSGHLCSKCQEKVKIAEAMMNGAA